MQFREVAQIINIMKLADTSEAKIEIGLNQLLIVALFVYF